MSTLVSYQTIESKLESLHESTSDEERLELLFALYEKMAKKNLMGFVMQTG